MITFRDASRAPLGSVQDASGASGEQLIIGCLQRIAEALERLADAAEGDKEKTCATPTN